MRTPAGSECRYFYGDYYRGREHEECRLLNAESPPIPWKAELCSTCPVPGILMANACPNLILRPELKSAFPFMKKQVKVRVSCIKSGLNNFDPHTGCGQCHPLPPEFRGDAL